MLIPFVGDAYKVRSINLNAQTCINLYPVIDKQGGKAPSALYRTPGLVLFADDDGEQQVRGLLEYNGVLYCVIDNKFYSVDTAGNRTERGTLLTSVGRVSMITNDLQIMIADNPYGYVYTLATQTFARNTDPDFPEISLLTYQDGYGIFPYNNSDTFGITDLFDFTQFDPAEFSGAASVPGNIVSIISSTQEVWIIKTKYTVLWYDTGELDFPFQQRQTVTFQFGCAAPFSVVKAANNSLFWLSVNDQSRGVIVRFRGYNPQIISTEAVNYAISTYERIDDAFSFAYEEAGHLFVVFTFPSADRTWVWDETTEMWHERRSQLDNAYPHPFPTRQGRWRPNCYALFNGKHIVGDYESGKLYYIDNNTYTENGTPITWERTAYHLAEDEKRLYITEFQLVMQSGTGLNTGQGSDPQVMLQVSKDLGHTFLAERWRSMGRQGEFTKRIRWTALGQARDWVFRVRGTDPVNVVILAARADVERER